MKLKTRNDHSWIAAGLVVNYHAVIGRPPTLRGLVVESGPSKLPSGAWVVWISGVRGCVSVDAVSPSVVGSEPRWRDQPDPPDGVHHD